MRAVIAIAALAGLWGLSPASRAEALEDVLARMDQSAANFRSVSADVKRVQFTAVLHETTESAGTIKLRKTKNATNGLVQFDHPETRIVHIGGKTVEVYYPKAKTVEIYDISKYVSNLDQFLLLGFGTTSADLRAAYDVKGGPAETIEGKQSTRIELVPKGAELKKLITKIELWVPQGESTPIREKITEPSKNYDLVTYSEIKLNPALPDAAFELKLPAGVKKIYPQK